MKSHSSTLPSRLASKALTSPCRVKIAAAGLDSRGRIIAIATNRPRHFHTSGGLHAEQRIIFSSPPSLSRIVLVRVSRRGTLLPISPCRKCRRFAASRGVTISPLY